VSGVVVLHMLDRASDGAVDRHPLKNLAIRHLVSAHYPDPARSEPRGVGVAPEDLRRPFLESRVGPSGSPVPRPMGLQVNIVEYPADCPGANRSYDPISDSLACQVFTGPVGDVQSLGHGLQAGQFDDLSPLEGGKSWPVAPNVLSGRRRVAQRHRWCDTDDRLSKPWLRRTELDRTTAVVRSPAARAKTIRARCTWNHGRPWLRAICRRSDSSRG
jgi:hypothetical protein